MEDFAQRVLNSFSGIDKNLDVQLNSCKIQSVEHTVVGMYINLEIDSEQKLHLTKVELGSNPINGPDLITPDGKSIGQCILFTTNGYAELIEIYTYTDNLPSTKEELEKIKLALN